MEKQRILPNGVIVTYFDESRKIAADRWVVRIRCLASIPCQDWMEDAMAGDDEKSAFCRHQFQGQLTYETVMERNFIDETEVPIVTAQICENFSQNTLRYLATEEFVRSLFATRLAEYADRFSLQEKVRSVPDYDDDDVSGPADFSHCFK